MAWPVDARYQNFVDGVTNIVAAFLHAIEDAIIGVYGGTKTLKSVQADGTGNQAATAAAGEVAGTALASNNIAYGLELRSSGTARTIVRAVMGQTTDATLTTLVTFATASGKAYMITTNMVGLKSDNTDGGAYWVHSCFKNNAGTVTNIGAGSATDITEENDATWTGVVWDFSGTTLRLRVQGKAATTINWVGTFTITVAG